MAKRTIFALMLTAAALSPRATASASEAKKEAPAEAKGEAKAEGKAEAKGEAKTEAKAEGKSEAKEGGEKGEGGKSELPVKMTATNHYVHHWLALPSFNATRIPGIGDQQHVEAVPGRMTVVVFIASWCEPCQQLMPELLKLEKHYRALPVDFIYVFAHDTREDAEGFLREFSMDGGYLANHDVLAAYHNPELPSVYVGDRHGWLMTRMLKTSRLELPQLNELLRFQASY